MVLSVVNLQEAYAKALLVDRAALRAAQEARRRARRPRGRCSTPTAPTSARCARRSRAGARRGRGPGRGAPRVAATPSASSPSAERPPRGRRVGPMSTSPTADRRPRRGPLARPRRCPSDALDAARPAASHLLGADRAVANFGGGNTSAKGTRDRPRRPRDRRHVGQGLGQRPRDDGRASTSPPLRLDEMLPLFERDEMSDEDMVAYLARCQLDPAMPRASIETLLHAFVPAAARPPHAPRRRSTCSPARATASASCAECFGDEAAWIPYIRPGFTLVQAGRRGGRATNPGLKLVVLAKHGLVVWGDTRRGGLPAHDRGRSTGRPTSSTSAPPAAPRFGGAARRRAARRRARARRCCASVLPGAARRGVERAAEGARRSTRRRASLEFVSLARRAASSSTVGAACPDHLVHTKRVPLWIPFDPATRRRRRAARADRASARRRYRDDYRAYVERHARRDDRARRPRPARRARSSTSGWSRSAPTTKAARALARPLPPRDRGDGRRARARRLRLARRRARASRSSTGRSSSTSSRWRRRPASCRARSRSSPARAGGIGRAIVDALAAARRVRRRASTSTATARPTRSRRSATRGSAVARRRHLRGRRSPRRSPRRSTRFGGVDIVVSNAGVASSAPIEETTLAEWERNHAILGTGYFLVAREAFARAARAGHAAARSCSSRSKNALVAGKNAAAYSSAKAAELHLARCLAEEGGAAGHPRQHGQPRRGARRARGSGTRRWREERAARLRHRARRARGALPRSAPRWASTSCPRTSPRRCCTSPRRRARARARATCSTSTAACRRPTRAERRA